jgi:hypothetical protein
MFILGLDPSLTGYGWCIFDSDAPSFVFDKGRWKTTPKELFVTRYISHRESIRELLIKNPDIKNVGIESPPFGEMWSEGLYGLFLFAIEAIYSEKRNVYFFDPLTVKSRAKEIIQRNKGKMFKSDMIKAAKKMTGIGRWNADESDAFHVSFLTYRFVSFLKGTLLEENLTTKEHWIFKGIKEFKRTGNVIKRGMCFKENDRYFIFNEEI